MGSLNYLTVLTILSTFLATSVLSLPWARSDLEKRNWEAPESDIALGSDGVPKVSSEPANRVENEPSPQIYPAQQQQLPVRGLTPQMYAQYVEELRELEMLEQFIEELHAEGYSDEDILQLLESMESEAVFDSVVEYPDPATYQDATTWNAMKRFQDPYWAPTEAQEGESDVISQDKIDQLESEFETLEKDRESADEKLETQMLTGEGDLGSDMEDSEEETNDVLEEADVIEELVEVLRDEKFSDAEIKQFFEEEFDIDLEFEGEEPEDAEAEDEKEPEEDQEADSENTDEEDEESGEMKKSASSTEDDDESATNDIEQEEEDDSDNSDNGEESEKESEDAEDASEDADSEEKEDADDQTESKFEQMSLRAYPFRKRSIEEVKSKKQDVDEDKAHMAGEDSWLNNEEELEETAAGSQDVDQDGVDELEKILNQIGYLEFQPKRR